MTMLSIEALIAGLNQNSSSGIYLHDETNSLVSSHDLVLVSEDRGDVLFCVSRMMANPHESTAIFLSAMLFCPLFCAPRTYNVIGVWGYLGVR